MTLMRQTYVRHGIAIALFMAVVMTPTQSQMTVKAGGGIGIASAVSDFNGTTLDYYGGTRYGMNSGLNLQGKAKLGLGGLDLVGEIDYASMGNNGNTEPGQGNVEITQNILSMKLGPEFHFGIPAFPMSPYVGMNLAVNSFSGETAFQGVSKVPSATYSVSDATRLGIGFTLGAEVSIGPFMALDFTTSYNFMNISGAEWEDVNPGINQRIDSYLTLNDIKDPLYVPGDDKHFISQDRSIHSMLFTVSILFGL